MKNKSMPWLSLVTLLIVIACQPEGKSIKGYLDASPDVFYYSFGGYSYYCNPGQVSNLKFELNWPADEGIDPGYIPPATAEIHYALRFPNGSKSKEYILPMTQPMSGDEVYTVSLDVDGLASALNLDGMKAELLYSAVGKGNFPRGSGVVMKTLFFTEKGSIPLAPCISTTPD